MIGRYSWRHENSARPHAPDELLDEWEIAAADETVRKDFYPEAA